MTARPEDLAGLPGWPRLLSRRQAACYLGVSPGTLDAHVGITPLRVGGRRLWDRSVLDRYVDSLDHGRRSPGDQTKRSEDQYAEEENGATDGTSDAREIDWGDIAARRADRKKRGEGGPQGRCTQRG